MYEQTASVESSPLLSDQFNESSRAEVSKHSPTPSPSSYPWLPFLLHLFKPTTRSIRLGKGSRAMRTQHRSTLMMNLGGAKIAKTHSIILLRVTLFLSCAILVLCLHTEQLLAKGQLVTDCKSTPSLRNGNAQFLVNEVRKFVDNCIKTKDNIRFRKRLLAPMIQLAAVSAIPSTIAAPKLTKKNLIEAQDAEPDAIPTDESREFDKSTDSDASISVTSDEVIQPDSSMNGRENRADKMKIKMHPTTIGPRPAGHKTKKSRFPFYRVGPENAPHQSRLLINAHIPHRRPPPPAQLLAAYLRDLQPSHRVTSKYDRVRMHH